MLRLGLVCCALLAALPAAALAQEAPPPAPELRVERPGGKPLIREGQVNRQLLGGTWYFRQDDTLPPVGEQERWFDQDDLTGWTAITVPHNWNATDTVLNKSSVGWYRKEFTLPRSPKKARHFWKVRFEGRIGRPARAPVDRIGFDRESGAAEDPDRARHVIGGRDQEPALAGLGRDHALGEGGVLLGVAGFPFQLDAAFRDTKALKQLARIRGLARPPRKKPCVAACEHDTRSRILKRQYDCRRYALGRFIERDLAMQRGERRTYRSTEDDDPGGRPFPGIPRRKPHLQRDREGPADRKDAERNNKQRARDQKPATGGEKPSRQKDNSGDPDQDEQIGRSRQKSENFGENEKHGCCTK